MPAGSPLARKLRTIGWFARRPRLYREFGRELHDMATGRTTGQDAETSRWCAARVVPVVDAIAALTGTPPDYRFVEHHAAAYAAARGRALAAKASEATGMPAAGAGDLDLAYWLTRRSGATTVVETGVAFGYSSLAFLLAMRDQPDARLVSTDMPLPRTTGAYVGTAIPPELRDRWTLHVGLDDQVLESVVAAARPFDVCHYDSDKREAGRRWGYPLLWDGLRPGGFFISDDVSDNPAFRQFSENLGVEPTIVEYDRKYVGVLVKPEATPTSS